MNTTAYSIPELVGDLKQICAQPATSGTYCAEPARLRFVPHEQKVHGLSPIPFNGT